MFSCYLEHTDPLFKKLKILNIYKVHEYLTSLFMFRYYKVQNLPEIFCIQQRHTLSQYKKRIAPSQILQKNKLHKTFTSKQWN